MRTIRSARDEVTQGLKGLPKRQGPLPSSADAVRSNMEYFKALSVRLQKIKVNSPAAEAERLIEHFGMMRRLEFFAGSATLLDTTKDFIEKALKMRGRGIPLAYVLGHAPFYGRNLAVSPAVLIPRPETERLVEEALDILKENFRGHKPDILDLGTGSGCIAVSLTLEGPPCKMTALDASKAALAVARKNLKLLGLQQKIRLVSGRFFEPFKGKTGLWDMVISNPPYVSKLILRSLPKEVRREPAMALDGGKDGLTAIRHILAEAPKYLKPGGWVLMEIGDGQAKAIRKIIKAGHGYAFLAFAKDLNGVERILIAKRSNG